MELTAGAEVIVTCDPTKDFSSTVIPISPRSLRVRGATSSIPFVREEVGEGGAQLKSLYGRHACREAWL